MFTNEELEWLREILDDYKLGDISPSYFYLKNTQKKRIENKEVILEGLESIRGSMVKFIPSDLMKLNSEVTRKDIGVTNFSGIYLIFNCTKNMYYVGKSIKVFDRVYKHFTGNESSNTNIYQDYKAGDRFEISLIPVAYTSFSTLNELEGGAIIAYQSEFPNGYNRVSGNILDKAIFKNENHKKAAYLLLERVIQTEGEDSILELTNSRKRTIFSHQLIQELQLPDNPSFNHSFRDFLQEYRMNIKNDESASV